MKRVINELTADEVKRGTGVKVGDFGTGGRTYVKHYERDVRRGGNGDNTTCLKICFFLAVLISIGCLGYVELTVASTSQMLEEAVRKAVSVNDPTEVDASMNGKLVFIPVHNTPKLAGLPPQDEFFGLPFSMEVATAKRVTEYCQWEERSHTREVKEGVNPQTGKEKIRKEKEYFYHKGWRSNIVNSAFFDNAVAYNNPSRDPAPSKMFHASGGIDLTGGKGKLTISSTDFENALMPFETVTLYKEGVKKLAPTALKEGFNEADHKYVYSRVPEDGWTGNPVLKAGAAYLIDGVVDVNEISKGTGFESLLANAGLDWITKGSCKAGDIRVHFETRRLPDSASVLGLVTAGGTKITPYLYSNGYSKVFTSNVATELTNFAKMTDNDTRRWAMWCRVGVALLLLAGAYAGSDLYAPGVGTLPLWTALSATIVGGAWTYAYGLGDKIALGVLGVGVALCGYVFVSSSKKSSGGKKPSNENNQFDNKTGEQQQKEKTA